MSRRVPTITTLLLGLALSSQQALGQESQRHELKKSITTASTSEDHHRMAALYRTEASEYLALQREHERMEKEYPNSRQRYSAKYSFGADHCRQWVYTYGRSAREALALADVHERMATETELPSAPLMLGSEEPDRNAASGTRDLYDQCISKANNARTQAKALLRVLEGGESKGGELRSSVDELSHTVDGMIEIHDRFLKTLSDRQWNRSERHIAKLEMLRAAVPAELEAIDLELRMPTPDTKVLARYAKRIDGDLKDWESLYRKISSTLGDLKGENKER